MPAQVEALSRLGVQQAQVFLFGKAMTASELVQLLSARPPQQRVA